MELTWHAIRRMETTTVPTDRPADGTARDGRDDLALPGLLPIRRADQGDSTLFAREVRPGANGQETAGASGEWPARLM